jgi:hypothetical protein
VYVKKQDKGEAPTAPTSEEATVSAGVVRFSDGTLMKVRSFAPDEARRVLRGLVELLREVRALVPRSRRTRKAR